MEPTLFNLAQGAVRAACAQFDDKGANFENLVRELLQEVGFFHVRRQRAGQQFGRDLSARLDHPAGDEATRWYFECKNLSDPVSTGEVAHKLIWHMSRELLTGGFVIVGPGTISNEVDELLRRTEFFFSIFNWTDENFIKLVGLCPRTAQRWFPLLQLNPDRDEATRWRTHLMAPERSGYEVPNPLHMQLRRRFPRSAQYAYFEKDGHFQKWETEVSFLHDLVLSNVAPWPLTITSIRVRTLSYEPLPSRLLVTEKALGAIQPLRLRYRPGRSEDSCVELLGRSMRHVHSREGEAFLLEMAPTPRPGLYDLQVEASGIASNPAN